MGVASIGKGTNDQILSDIAAKRWDRLRQQLPGIHPSDLSDLIAALAPDDTSTVFNLLPRDLAATVFPYLPHERQEHLVHSLTGEKLTQIFNDISPDDRTRIFETLPAAVTQRVLEQLSPEELHQARDLLAYPDDVAGRYMTPDYVSIRPEMNAAQALDHIRVAGRDKEMLHVVYVIDEAGRLINDIRLGSLVLSDREANASEIEPSPLIAIGAMEPVENVIAAFEKYDRVALPVVNTRGEMLGIITADDVLDLVEQESTEDIQKIGGSQALERPYLELGFWSMVKKRGGWLSVLFLGEMLTASAMGRFENEIERAVVLALFIPLVISSGGNSGSQAASIIIRSLAINELRLGQWLRVFWREVGTSLALGAFLGLIGFVRIVLWQRLHLFDYGPHFQLVALTVAASLVGVVMFGSVTGSMLPFLMRRVGFDPATSSAPFVATLVDVTGLVIYFSIALVILRGTLL
jgi:magnesium transporter